MNIVSDFKNFQEFFISLGWGGHTSIHCELCDFENYQEFFISQGWGRDTKLHCELCDFKNYQEFFISQGWGESKVECGRLGKFPGILYFSRVGGEQSRM